MIRNLEMVVTITLLFLACGCAEHRSIEPPPLTGAWRSTVQFKDGAFAGIKDLEFMYVFNAGGTLTESSNYDGVPPVPPAYGVWRQLGPNEFEARYEFFSTMPPSSFDALKDGGGWLPAGRGVLIERIRLSDDGRTFTSTIRYEARDSKDQPAVGGGEAEGRGVRIHL